MHSTCLWNMQDIISLEDWYISVVYSLLVVTYNIYGQCHPQLEIREIQTKYCYSICICDCDGHIFKTCQLIYVYYVHQGVILPLATTQSANTGKPRSWFSALAVITIKIKINVQWKLFKSANRFSSGGVSGVSYQSVCSASLQFSSNNVW